MSRLGDICRALHSQQDPDDPERLAVSRQIIMTEIRDRCPEVERILDLTAYQPEEPLILLDEDDDACDLILAHHVLEHLIALPATLVDLRRVAPLMAVAVPCPPADVMRPGHFWTMPKGGWVHLFMQTGWLPESIWTPDAKEYIWILQRAET